MAMSLSDRKSPLLLRQNVLNDFSVPFKNPVNSSLPFALGIEKEDEEAKVNNSTFNGFLNILL